MISFAKQTLHGCSPLQRLFRALHLSHARVTFRRFAPRSGDVVCSAGGLWISWVGETLASFLSGIFIAGLVEKFYRYRVDLFPSDHFMRRREAADNAELSPRSAIGRYSLFGGEGNRNTDISIIVFTVRLS